MIVRCPTCGATLDEAEKSTVCPHQPLGTSATTYCKKHDLFDCHICATDAKDMPIKPADSADMPTNPENIGTLSFTVKVHLSAIDPIPPRKTVVWRTRNGGWEKALDLSGVDPAAYPYWFDPAEIDLTGYIGLMSPAEQAAEVEGEKRLEDTRIASHPEDLNPCNTY